MTIRDDNTLPEHPLTKIQQLIDELREITRPVYEYEQKDVDEMWDVLGHLIVMVATTDDRIDLLYKATVLDRITDMIASCTNRIKEIADVDSVEEDRRGDRDRGSDQSGSPRSEAGSSPSGD